jgi:hypothetical protein
VNLLTDFEELAWRYYIESADDFGVMRFSPLSLQADHERMAKRPARVVMKALERVLDVGLIRTFEHQGRAYCFQVDWQDFQKVDYPRPTVHPMPPRALLGECSTATQILFEHHPGGKRFRKKPGCGSESSDSSPETFPENSRLTRAHTLATATAEGSGKGSEGRARETSRGKAHDGPRLTVWHWQHEDLGKRLGAKVDTFDLLGWYSRLEEELARTGESFADPWKWLTHRLYVDADLPLPNLIGRESKRRGSSLPDGSEGGTDWMAECRRLHGGSCDGHKGIHDEKIADAWCEHTPRCADRAAHAIAVHREKGRVAS